MISPSRRVCMYAAFCPKRCYIGKMLTGRAYISGQKSRQMKSEKNLTDGRNGFTESRFPEQESQRAEMRGNHTVWNQVTRNRKADRCYL